MNERIHKLIRDVGFTYSDLVDGRDQMLIEFAELIVRDCISVLQNVPNGYNDYRNQIEDADRRYCISYIKEHFGVE
jgi:hypothetical protein